MIEVIDPGLLLTLQDLGRPGRAHLGIPRSGAADRASLAAANELVGNDAGAAAFETTITGCELLFHSEATVAVAGADAELGLGGDSVPFGEPFTVPAESRLVIGPARSCVRSYVGVSGGLEGPSVLGSVATDLLTGLGSPPLGRADRVGLARQPVAAASTGPSAPVEPVGEVAVEPGPREGGGRLHRILLSTEWTVSPRSNRIGVRLESDALGARASDLPAEMPRSEGLPSGAIQLTPGGEPIIMLADRPTTGGYPVAGVVDPGQLDLVARLRPGQPLRLIG